MLPSEAETEPEFCHNYSVKPHESILPYIAVMGVTLLNTLSAGDVIVQNEDMKRHEGMDSDEEDGEDEQQGPVYQR